MVKEIKVCVKVLNKNRGNACELIKIILNAENFAFYMKVEATFLSTHQNHYLLTAFQSMFLCEVSLNISTSKLFLVEVNFWLLVN